MAVGAYSFYHQVGTFLLEAFRQRYLRHVRIVETVGLLALFAIEMGVYVLIVVVVVAVTELIAHAVAAVLEDVNEVVLSKQRQRAEDARLVNGQDLVLQLG